VGQTDPQLNDTASPSPPASGSKSKYSQSADATIRDDGKVLGCIMRFYEENCPTYARTETKRLGPKKDDQAARRAVEEAII
jgi:hypothetical protein